MSKTYLRIKRGRLEFLIEKEVYDKVMTFYRDIPEEFRFKFKTIKEVKEEDYQEEKKSVEDFNMSKHLLDVYWKLLEAFPSLDKHDLLIKEAVTEKSDKFVLVRFNKNYADEFDMEGMWLYNKSEWESLENLIDSSGSYSFGTNEEWDELSSSDFTAVELTDEELKAYRLLIKNDAFTTGYFPDLDRLEEESKKQLVGLEGVIELLYHYLYFDTDQFEFYVKCRNDDYGLLSWTLMDDPYIYDLLYSEDIDEKLKTAFAEGKEEIEYMYPIEVWNEILEYLELRKLKDTNGSGCYTTEEHEEIIDEIIEEINEDYKGKSLILKKEIKEP